MAWRITGILPLTKVPRVLKQNKMNNLSMTELVQAQQHTKYLILTWAGSVGLLNLKHVHNNGYKELLALLAKFE